MFFVSERWRVLKFGGTSVAGLAQWQTIAALAVDRHREGDRVLLVCSALAGVTNLLETIARSGSDATRLIQVILDKHRALAVDLDIDAGSLIEDFSELLQSGIQDCLQNPGPQSNAALFALGEQMSSGFGHLYLSGSMDVDLVDAREALEVIPEEDPDSSRAWLSARCESGSDERLRKSWSAKSPVLITQGYVASTFDGRTALLGRGGSDTSAALLASRLSATEVEIWTDVPGLFSADPGIEPGALLLKELNYAEALEMAASGARVVHPRCIRAAADVGLAIQVRDINRPDLQGTRITGSQPVVSENAPAQGIKAVTCQDGMLVLLLENLDTRQQVGFLAWVFGVFSKLGLSIDLVATSETTTTVAINGVDNTLDSSLIDDMRAQLSLRCKVRLYQDCCCVNLVGLGARTALSQLAPAATGFDEWPLLMLSQSANDMSISMLVHTEHAQQLVHDLHRCLIIEGEIARQGLVYGPSWSKLRDP
ncbi:MAG: diaminopimelate decarboxylase/aspartate kinase [Lysobacterales bacterium]